MCSRSCLVFCPSRTAHVSVMKSGDIYRYRPASNHCREGVAVAVEVRPGLLVLIDTYWATTHAKLLTITTDSHALDAAERATAKFQFNLHDYRPAERHERTDVYEPEAVRTVSAQHGLVSIAYVDPSATRSNRVILERQTAAVAAAADRVESAQHGLECEIRELARMRTVGLVLGLFAVGAILAAPHTSETKTTTYTTTTAGGFEYDYATAFGSKQFLFEAFDGDVISTVACHPSRTSFVAGDPTAPTLTVTASREAYQDTLLLSVPREVLDCEVAGLGDFADNYWTER